MVDVMTPVNPRWAEFAQKLSDKLNEVGGCDGYTLTGSALVLQEMGLDGLGVELSLQHFRKHGGGCDCEVLMNVPFSQR